MNNQHRTYTDAAGKVLNAAAILLAEYHLLWFALRYYLPKNPWIKISRWGSLVFFASAAIYGILRSVRSTAFRKQCVQYLKKHISFEQLFLLLWLVWFILGCLIHQIKNGSRAFMHNDYKLLVLVLVCFLFFPFTESLSSNRMRHVIDRMLQILVFVYTIYTVWILWQYFHMNYLTFPSGNVLEMTSAYSLRMGNNRNTGSAQCTTVLAVCLYFFFTVRPVYRPFYFAAGFIQLTTILLTGSRSGYLASMTMLMTAAFFAVWWKWQDKKTSVRIAGGAVAALICLILCAWLRREVFILLNAATHFMDKDPQAALRDLDDVSGRTKIWKATIKLMFSGPLRFMFGVTPAFLVDHLAMTKLFTKQFYHAHNILLTIGASYGVPAMIGYLLFLFSILRRSIRLLFSGRKNLIPNAWVVPVSILSLVMIDMVESFLAINNEIPTPVFYLFCGYIVLLDRSADSKK